MKLAVDIGEVKAVDMAEQFVTSYVGGTIDIRDILFYGKNRIIKR